MIPTRSQNYAWYVLQTKPSGEYCAKKNLQMQKYKVFLPEYNREAISKSVKKIKVEPLFPRYIFVWLSKLESDWRPLRSTKGVSRIVEFGNGPVSIDEDIVRYLDLWEKKKEVQSSFKPGDEVLITKGSFRNMRAIYDAPDGDHRAVLLLNILSAKRKLSFGLESIEQY
jgi:transcriptional antiterminator RfaH